MLEKEEERKRMQRKVIMFLYPRNLQSVLRYCLWLSYMHETARRRSRRFHLNGIHEGQKIIIRHQQMNSVQLPFGFSCLPSTCSRG